jgi:hypothetical protein
VGDRREPPEFSTNLMCLPSIEKQIDSLEK